MIVTLTSKQLSMVINMTLALMKIKKIICKYNKPESYIRPSAHVILYGDVGTGKSSILEDICKIYKITKLIGLNRTHILGSVDADSRNLIPPAVWTNRNKILPIDEFHVSEKTYNEKDALRTLLQIMEVQKFQKKVGYRCNLSTLKDKDLYCIVKNNSIECNTKFTFFATTMMNIKSHRMIEIQALASRCICIPFFPTYDMLMDRARGKSFYVYKDIKVDPIVIISKKTYLKILKYIEKDKDVIPKNKYFRMIGELCRAYAVFGFNEEIFDILKLLAR